MRIHVMMGHNLIDPDSIVSAHGDKPVTTHASWLKASLRCGGIARPLPAIDRLPPRGSIAITPGATAAYPILLTGCNRNAQIMDSDQFTALGRSGHLHLFRPMSPVFTKGQLRN